MVDITNPIFRHMCSNFGADYTYTEMVSTSGIINNNEKTNRLCESIDDSPYSIQLCGSNFDMFYKSIVIIEKKYKPTAIDINMGCPSKKIISCGCGAALLKKDPKDIRKELEDLCSITTIPITAKIRILENENKTIDMVTNLEKSGIEAICVHGRTSRMKYSGNVNINMIKEIKKNVSIPVIANGDINNIETAKKILDKTNCDGIMIGRAAIGNPNIFTTLKNIKLINENEDMNIKDLKNNYDS